jgi:hypothetical protein
VELEEGDSRATPPPAERGADHLAGLAGGDTTGRTAPRRMSGPDASHVPSPCRERCPDSPLSQRLHEGLVQRDETEQETRLLRQEVRRLYRGCASD